MFLGCKIKLLRQKTNTYIKTPGRGDNPQFVITGKLNSKFTLFYQFGGHFGALFT